MKGKIIQIQATGVDNDCTTQTSYMLTVLTDAGEIFQRRGICAKGEWDEVDFSKINYLKNENNRN